MRDILFILIILHSINSFSQELQYESEDMVIVSSELDAYEEEITQLDSFPMNIRERFAFILENQTGEFSDNMTFVRGWNLHLANYFKDYPRDLNKYNNLIPHYGFHYIFCDTTAGISRYDFLIGIDDLGQIVYFHFPHKYDLRAYTLMPLDDAMRIADSLTSIEKYNFEDLDYFLHYDTQKNDLIWQVCYSKSDTVDNEYLESNFLNFVFSTKEHKLLKMDYDTSDLKFTLRNYEAEMLESWYEE